MDNVKTGLLGLPARRKAAGYTQEDFAAALGVTRSALAAWETARAWPPAAILPAIADLLLCSIEDLYKAPQDPEPREADPGPGPVGDPGPSIVKLYGGGYAIEYSTADWRG